MKRRAFLVVFLGGLAYASGWCGRAFAGASGLSAEVPPAGDARAELGTADWPWWRGPELDGKSRDDAAPTTWGRTQNVVWKATVPGRGHSSPIVFGDRVVLTTADEAAQKQIVL